jgi:hypothetical protein
MTVVEITLGARMPRDDAAVRFPSTQSGGTAVTDQLLTGVLALAPERGAAATIAQMLALPDLANDTIVILGDTDARQGKRRTYREIFSLLGRAQRPVLWVPGPVDRAFAGDVRRAYQRAMPRTAAPYSANPPLDTGMATPANELLSELVRSFKPRLAARLVRPAVYTMREQGNRQWLEL